MHPKPVYELVWKYRKTELRDELDEKWIIDWESRWLNLNVERTKDGKKSNWHPYYAFVDTYKSIAQIHENHRHDDERRYFEKVVGSKLSAAQLETVARDIFGITQVMKEGGVTTVWEYEQATRSTTANNGGEQKPSLTEQDLKGKTRHNITDFTFIDPGETKKFEKAIDSQPVYVDLHAKKEHLEKIAGNNSLLRRYKDQEEEGEVLSSHAVMGIGRGLCYHAETGQQLYYIVGQNNWPDDSSEICRIGYDALKTALTFNIPS